MIWERLVDWVFPKICVGCGGEGAWVCKKCRGGLLKPAQKCPGCTKVAVGGKRHISCRGKTQIEQLTMVWGYKDEVVKKVIEQMKYGFAREVVDELLEGFVFKEKCDLIVPVPLFWYRENWRGFNQAELIARRLDEKKVGLACFRKMSWRRQVQTKTKSERVENMRGLFGVKENYWDLIKRKKILLVDDVYTTGATMGEVARVLKQAGARSIVGLVLAG